MLSQATTPQKVWSIDLGCDNLQAGDSGSWVVHKHDNVLLGVLIARSSNSGFLAPFTEVQKEIGAMLSLPPSGIGLPSHQLDENFPGISYTENEINQALADMANGISARNASRRWGVPRSTLQDRTKGAQQRAAAFEDLQRLSHTQEAKLASWVQIQADLGLPPTHQQVKDFAQRILHAMGDTQPLGKRWMDGFLRRNPSIKAMVQISRDASHHSHQTS
ncbi:hypothetical protein CGCF413_v004529 [Colletotrichum fructicola]|nr:hypothetical protein CGCF413_v004529 [Colletotrichum fructicola]